MTRSFLLIRSFFKARVIAQDPRDDADVELVVIPLTKAQTASLYQAAQRDMAAGRLNAAAERFQKVHDAAPNLAEPLFHLGRIARQQGNLAAAHDFLTKAQVLRPKEPAILQALAEVQQIHGDPGKALKSFDALIALQPGHPKPLADKALFLQQQGDFAAAEGLFKKAMRRAPNNGELYRMWMADKTLAKGDPNIRKMQQLFKHPRMSDNGRIHLGFALAKAMEDSGQYDKVFSYLNVANRLQRKAFPYDPDVRDAEVTTIIQSLSEIGPQGDSDFDPIIVTGMPRSGTTLVEQVLAAHENVVAGGELAIGLRLAYDQFGVPPKITPLGEISMTDLRQFADRFAAQVAGRVDAQGRRVTDKSIQNHLILGHLHRALPKAGLVVVRRDPRAIALSIYKNYFEGGTHRYSNDLGDIARYIKSFDRIVTFLKARIPVYEISYDALIAAPEAEARALLAALGLDWQHSVLDFHKQGGAVRTLSLAQVRKPIYKSSGAAWQRYEDELAPFITELEAN